MGHDDSERSPPHARSTPTMVEHSARHRLTVSSGASYACVWLNTVFGPHWAARCGPKPAPGSARLLVSCRRLAGPPGSAENIVSGARSVEQHRAAPWRSRALGPANSRSGAAAAAHSIEQSSQAHDGPPPAGVGVFIEAHKSQPHPASARSAAPPQPLSDWLARRAVSRSGVTFACLSSSCVFCVIAIELAICSPAAKSAILYRLTWARLLLRNANCGPGVHFHSSTPEAVVHQRCPVGEHGHSVTSGAACTPVIGARAQLAHGDLMRVIARHLAALCQQRKMGLNTQRSVCPHFGSNQKLVDPLGPNHARPCRQYIGN